MIEEDQYDVVYCPFCAERNTVKLSKESKVEDGVKIIITRINGCKKCNTQSWMVMGMDATPIKSSTHHNP